jgi:hypothetical protein
MTMGGVWDFIEEFEWVETIFRSGTDDRWPSRSLRPVKKEEKRRIRRLPAEKGWDRQ